MIRRNQDSPTQAFIDALHRLEDDSDPEPLLNLLDNEVTIETVAHGAPLQGRDAAQGFWRDYRQAFERIHSDFTHVQEGDGFAALEWRSEGQIRDGEPVSYRGVSLLEIRDGRIARFSTYYDSAAFLPGGAKHAR